MLSQLDDVQFCDISVRPFQIQIDGVNFGLVADDDHGCVHLQPGSQITFMEPWDGEYYT
ncbi:hypothetical protein Rcae01_06750 [Novipirellula caenicola]|uniref:Uncharacterized protein n=1 Tax=Novipirellula caenicola TaxID=1536901 RepID=A0ABP9W1J5_9BACT